jgi:ubiquinone/menaquinone biosynthesis C-methylase UbiE
MTDEQQLQQRAAQLRKPQGEYGIQVGEWMSKGNQQIIHDTLSILNAEEDDNILEIGMGNGYFVNKILSLHQTITYTGCDYSELMIEESEKINAEWISNGQAKFILSDVTSLPCLDNSFNKIVTINTIYFWDYESKILNELKRVLQPKGKLIIGFRPKRQTEKYPFTKYGFNLFSKEDVVTLLSDNGFTVSDAIENNEPDFDMNGEIMKMENVVVVAIKN